MESVIQKERFCWVCETTQNLNVHHIFPGASRRKQSEKRGFKVYLCAKHHAAVHQHINSGHSLMLKRICQLYYEEKYGSREDFIREFGRSVL